MGKKNVQGGNKTKALARKNTYDTADSRVPLHSEEKYGIIKSVSGSGRFRIESSDHKMYVGILPGSMRGHKKRNHYVALDSFVLFNDRTSWQTAKDNSHADIIHVYTHADAERLGLRDVFQTNDNKNSNCTHDNLIFQDGANCETPDDGIITVFPCTETQTVTETDIDFDFI